MEINDKRGSIWRKWDLHLHTPDTKLNPNGYELKDKKDKWIKYCEELEKSDVQVFGITDYFSSENHFKLLDTFTKKYPHSSKIFFPNLELRLEVSVNKAGEEVNIHILFSNKVSSDEIKDFLSKLETNITKNGAVVTCDKLKTSNDYEKASVKYSDIKPALKKVFGDKRPYIIIAASNNQGIRADNNSPRKLNISDEIDKICNAFFGNSNNPEYFLNTERYELREDGTRDAASKCPVFACSDSHSFSDLKNKLGKSFEKRDEKGKICDSSQITWIKSDKTFEGLIQTLIEPEERVFIGEIPPSKQRVEQNKTKYIKELKLNKIKGSTLDETWFENIEPIPLNTDLVAIIGNKGNGKSAIADILGLLGNTKNHGGFSFLNKDKFRKPRPNRAESFEASIEWENGTKDSPVILSTNPEGSLPEKVKYIPQSYLEKLCTETDEAKFSEELKNVIFSHVDASEKLGKHSLDELIEYKSEEINKGIQSLINELSEINHSIEGLEVKSTPEYRAQRENALKLKKEEQKEHKKTKPAKVKEPKKDSSVQQEQTKTTKKVEELKVKQKEIELTLAEKKERRKNNALKLAKLQKFEQSADNLKQQFDKLKEQYSEDLSEYDIKFELIIKLTVNKKTIDVNIADTKKLIESIDKELNNQIEGSLSFNYAKNQKELKDLQSKLDEPTRKYQEYLDKLQEWEDKDKGLIGTEEQQGSIKFYESILKYLDEKLNIEISEEKQKRKILVKQIFKEKSKIVQLYKELYSPVTRFIGEYSQLMNEYPINIDVSIQLDNFHDKFFDYISRGSKGSFIGTEEGYITLSEVTEGVDFNNEESVFNFLDEIISLLGNDKRTEKKDKRRISDQLKQGFEVKSFYDFLFSIEYLKPNYKLKLSLKNLSELSPGERGALLLIFYLLLDKQDIPLIIDQPEENLDNQSVYTVLVKFIKEAKKKRQIIIVTHNPNLAVVCDAEQIIYVKIQKENKNKVVVKSGAIENSEINSKIVEILEGTFPAFENRSEKYRISR